MKIRKAENLPTNLVLCGIANETDHCKWDSAFQCNKKLRFTFYKRLFLVPVYLHYGESNKIVINLDVAQSGDVEILVQQIGCHSENLGESPQAPFQLKLLFILFDRSSSRRVHAVLYATTWRCSEFQF